MRLRVLLGLFVVFCFVFRDVRTNSSAQAVYGAFSALLRIHRAMRYWGQGGSSLRWPKALPKKPQPMTG